MDKRSELGYSSNSPFNMDKANRINTGGNGITMKKTMKPLVAVNGRGAGQLTPGNNYSGVTGSATEMTIETLMELEPVLLEVHLSNLKTKDKEIFMQKYEVLGTQMKTAALTQMLGKYPEVVQSVMGGNEQQQFQDGGAPLQNQLYGNTPLQPFNIFPQESLGRQQVPLMQIDTSNFYDPSKTQERISEISNELMAQGAGSYQNALTENYDKVSHVLPRSAFDKRNREKQSGGEVEPSYQNLGTIRFDSNASRPGPFGQMVVKDENSGKDYGVVRNSDGSYRFYDGKDPIGTRTVTSISPGEDKVMKESPVINYYNEYAKSPKFKERLKKSSADFAPSTDYTITVDPTSPLDFSHYNSNTKKVRLSTMPDDRIGLDPQVVLAHELSHATRMDIVSDSQINRVQNEFLKKSLKDKHDASPREYKADLDAVRFLLRRERLYDATTQDFDKGILDKVKKTPISKDPTFKRLLRNSRGEGSLIKAFNELVDVPEPTQMTIAAEGGATHKIGVKQTGGETWKYEAPPTDGFFLAGIESNRPVKQELPPQGSGKQRVRNSGNGPTAFLAPHGQAGDRSSWVPISDEANQNAYLAPHGQAGNRSAWVPLDSGLGQPQQPNTRVPFAPMSNTTAAIAAVTNDPVYNLVTTSMATTNARYEGLQPRQRYEQAPRGNYPMQRETTVVPATLDGFGPSSVKERYNALSLPKAQTDKFVYISSDRSGRWENVFDPKTRARYRRDVKSGKYYEGFSENPDRTPAQAKEMYRLTGKPLPFDIK